MNTVQVANMKDYIGELNEVRATLKFIQTAFAEGVDSIDMKDTSDTLRHQSEILKNMVKELNGGGTDE